MRTIPAEVGPILRSASTALSSLMPMIPILRAGPALIVEKPEVAGKRLLHSVRADCNSAATVPA